MKNRFLTFVGLTALLTFSTIFWWYGVSKEHPRKFSHTHTPTHIALSRHAQALPKKPMFPVIDVHTHLAPSALKEAVRLMNQNGIKRMINLSGGPPGGRLERVLQASRKYPGRFLVFTTPDFSLLDEPNGPQLLARSLLHAYKLGARGLKITKALGLRMTDEEGHLYPVDSPKFAPLWEMAGKLDIPVAIHTGDPKAFFAPLTPQNPRYAELSLNPHWSFADRKRFPRWETLYKQFLRVVERHPKTTFIGVHFGNNPEDVAAVARALTRYPNLYVDIAARLPALGRQDWTLVRRIFLRHYRKILFGTDLAVRPPQAGEDHRYRYTLGAPMRHKHTRRDVHRFYRIHWGYLQTNAPQIPSPTPIQGNWTLHGLHLPPYVLARIYYKNATQLLHIKTQ